MSQVERDEITKLCSGLLIEASKDTPSQELVSAGLTALAQRALCDLNRIADALENRNKL